MLSKQIAFCNEFSQHIGLYTSYPTLFTLRFVLKFSIITSRIANQGFATKTGVQFDHMKEDANTLILKQKDFRRILELLVPILGKTDRVSILNKMFGNEIPPIKNSDDSSPESFLGNLITFCANYSKTISDDQALIHLLKIAKDSTGLPKANYLDQIILELNQQLSPTKIQKLNAKEKESIGKVDFSNSIVHIQSQDPNNLRSCTGFVVHKDQDASFILTCAHIINDIGGKEQVKVQNLDVEVESIDRGDESVLNLAVLKVKTTANLIPLKLNPEVDINSLAFVTGFSSSETSVARKRFRIVLRQHSYLKFFGYESWIMRWQIEDKENLLLQFNDGSPVMLENNNEVLGLIVPQRQKDQSKSIIYILSIEALSTVWNNLPPNIFAKIKRPKNIYTNFSIEEGLELDRKEQQAKARNRVESPELLVINSSLLYRTPYFFNRDNELNLLKQYLLNPRINLINVVGEGGYGKTALVSKVFLQAKDGWLEVINLGVHRIACFNPQKTGLTLKQLYFGFGKLLGSHYKTLLDTQGKSEKLTLKQKSHFLIDQINEACPKNKIILTMFDSFEHAIDETGQIIDEGLSIFLEAFLKTGGVMKIVVTSRRKPFLFANENVAFLNYSP